MNSGLYYLAITEEYVKTQVHNLDRVSTLQGRNLPLDRFYTSLKLAEWLWEKNYFGWYQAYYEKRCGQS